VFTTLAPMFGASEQIHRAVERHDVIAGHGSFEELDS